jgi:uncharacterized protein (UPF0248 family)
VKSGNF